MITNYWRQIIEVNGEIRFFTAGLIGQAVDAARSSAEETNTRLKTEEEPIGPEEFERLIAQRAIESYVQKLTDEGFQVKALNELHFAGDDLDWMPQSNNSDFETGSTSCRVEVWNEPKGP